MLHTHSWLQVILLVCVATDCSSPKLSPGSLVHQAVSPFLSIWVRVFGLPVLFKSMWLFTTKRHIFSSPVKGILYCSTEQVGSDELTNSIGPREEGKRQIYSIRMKDTLKIHKRHAPRNTNTSEKVTADLNPFWMWVRQIKEAIQCSTWFIVINKYFNIENIKAKMCIIFWHWFSFWFFFLLDGSNIALFL